MFTIVLPYKRVGHALVHYVLEHKSITTTLEQDQYQRVGSFAFMPALWTQLFWWRELRAQSLALIRCIFIKLHSLVENGEQWQENCIDFDANLMQFGKMVFRQFVRSLSHLFNNDDDDVYQLTEWKNNQLINIMSHSPFELQMLMCKRQLRRFYFLFDRLGEKDAETRKWRNKQAKHNKSNETKSHHTDLYGNHIYANNRTQINDNVYDCENWYFFSRPIRSVVCAHVCVTKIFLQPNWIRVFDQVVKVHIHPSCIICSYRVRCKCVRVLLWYILCAEWSKC